MRAVLEISQRKLLQESTEDLCKGRTCSGQGTCDQRGCICNDGFEGPDCQFDKRREPQCGGALSGDGNCCESGVFSIGGDCCIGENMILDGNGLCCEGKVDVCGICGGESKFVDVVGQCCSTILDGGGICCPSGRIDECGVCDGDGSSCRLEVFAEMELKPNDQLNDIRTCLADKVAATSTVKDKVFNVTIYNMKDGKENGTTLVDFIVTGSLATTFSMANLTLNSAADPIDPSDACIARKIIQINRVPTHGNNMCEIGEMPGVPGFGTKIPFEFKQDCQNTITACPSGLLDVIPGGMCSGKGRCMFASGGICDCFVGYDGDACDQCAANWFKRNGACYPRQNLLLAGEQEPVVSAREGGSDNVSQAAVISVGLIGAFLIVLLLGTVILGKFVSKRKRARPPTEGQEEVITIATDSDLSNEEARSLSSIWRAFLSEIGTPGSGATPTVDPSMLSPAGTEGGGPSRHDRAVSMSESMESTSTAAEDSWAFNPTHSKTLSSETWFTATSRGFSNRTEYFTARESFGSSSQFTQAQLSNNLVL